VLDGTYTWETYMDNGANVVTNAGLSFDDAGYIGYGTSGLAGIVSGADAAIGSMSYASLSIPVFYPNDPPTTFYYSFLVKREGGAISLNANGTRPNAPYGAYVSGIYAGDANDWTLDAYNQPTNTFPEDPTGIPATADETFFVVMRWSISGNWNITVDLAVNPSFDAEPTSWDATLNFERSITFSIWRMGVYQGDNATIFDEMRIATTWEDALPVAVPEPSACALIFGGLATLTVRRRRFGCAKR
jgi:hypothetical protein